MKRLVLPVIHYLDADTAIAQATLAFSLGADGVFLISHSNDDAALRAPALEIKGRFPEKLIGINNLSMTALHSLVSVEQLALDMVWVDAPGVSSAGATHEAQDIAGRLGEGAPVPLFFGSVAFKYQRPVDPDPGVAAKIALEHRMIPTTSGTATGSAPTIDKMQRIREAIGPDQPLAVASGMTPENVAGYLPFVTHFLVATGVSDDDHHFNAERLAAFIGVVRGGVVHSAV